MIEFLTPLGWLVACAALLPVGSALLRARRERSVRTRLALAPPGPAARVATTAAAALAIALLAAATARPALPTAGVHRVRTDAEIYFVVDISRSMLARRGPHGAMRYTRALAAADAIRSKLADIPAGIASLTDRPLPHLFPTVDAQTFSAVLHRSLGIERPPPQAIPGALAVVTNFDSLSEVATAGYFTAGTKHKLVILLSDGESNRYTPGALATVLNAERIGFLVVRFWDDRERVYLPSGVPEQYRPDASTLLPLRVLAGRTSGRRVFGEHELNAVVRAARAWLGRGPTVRLGRPRHVELAPYAVLAAVLPIAFLLRRRDP